MPPISTWATFSTEWRTAAGSGTIASGCGRRVSKRYAGLPNFGSKRTRPAREATLERLLEIAPFDLEAVGRRLDSLVREMRLGEARRSYGEWRTRYRAAIGVDAPAIWEPGPMASLEP